MPWLGIRPPRRWSHSTSQRHDGPQRAMTSPLREDDLRDTCTKSELDDCQFACPVRSVNPEVTITKSSRPTCSTAVPEMAANAWEPPGTPGKRNGPRSGRIPRSGAVYLLVAGPGFEPG